MPRLLGEQPKDNQAKALAVSVLDRASALKFADPRLWQRVADLYSTLDQPKKAIAIYQKLLTDYPEASLMRDTLHEKLAGMYVADRRQDQRHQTIAGHCARQSDPLSASLVIPG